MKKFIALLAAFAAAACHAQALPATAAASGVRQVSVQKPAAGEPFAPRQLSAQERAELRRQLSQYSRVLAKGS